MRHSQAALLGTDQRRLLTEERSSSFASSISVDPASGVVFYNVFDTELVQTCIRRVDPSTLEQSEFILKGDGNSLHVTASEVFDFFFGIRLANRADAQPEWTSITFPFAEVVTSVAVDPQTQDIIFSYPTSARALGVGRYNRGTQEILQTVFSGLDGESGGINLVQGTDIAYVVADGDVVEIDILTGSERSRFALGAGVGAWAIEVGKPVEDPADSEVFGSPLILEGPAMSGAFGTEVFALPNGNLVVTDPEYDDGAGAVYLYSPALVQISRLAGAVAGDRVGSGGVTVLPSGNFVVVSPEWNEHSGAVTWCSGNDGVDGLISSANSLVGSSAYDSVGSGGLTELPNGSVVVSSSFWNGGRGAATLVDGDLGVAAPVSASNSLVGGSPFDQISSGGITVLANGHYVVSSPRWDRETVTEAGAATWVDSDTGVTGLVSASNSLVGSASFDFVSGFADTGIVALANGNYVVASPFWDNGQTPDIGAATWGNGTTGTVGEISSANSLVGSFDYDRVSQDGVTALTNGNYVVLSKSWNSVSGAVTWGDGESGSIGAISITNSLVGQNAFYGVGSRGVTALANGNYVVATTNRTAATWADGDSGISGTISSVNSMLFLGAGPITVYALSNGNYVAWNGMSAAAWGDGSLGSIGFRSSSSTRLENIKSVTPLSDGNYAVTAPIVNTSGSTWVSGSEPTFGRIGSTRSFAGAVEPVGVVEQHVDLGNGHYLILTDTSVTWAEGGRLLVGEISQANSLLSAWPENELAASVALLADGNYVIASPKWGHVPATAEGAVTWGGVGGVQGYVDASNSIIGDSSNDEAGSGGVFALPGGRYAIHSPLWDNLSRANAGAMTLVEPKEGTTGTISSSNSLLGTVAGGGDSMSHAYDSRYHRLLVGYPAGNYVGLLGFSVGITVEQPLGDSLARGGRRSFGEVPVGRAIDLEFAIANRGSVSLTGIEITMQGDGFEIVEAPATTINPDESTVFTVRFLPDLPEARSATVTIAYDHPSNETFEFSLDGQGIVWGLDAWRSSQFSESELAAPAISAPDADPDDDGWVNLLEYVLMGSPKFGDPSRPALSGFVDDRLKLSFVRDRAAVDIDLMIEAADSPAGPWDLAATSHAGGAFIAESGYSVEEDTPAGRVVVADKRQLSAPLYLRRFLRLTAVLNE